MSKALISQLFIAGEGRVSLKNFPLQDWVTVADHKFARLHVVQEIQLTLWTLELTLRGFCRSPLEALLHRLQLALLATEEAALPDGLVC